MSGAKVTLYHRREFADRAAEYQAWCDLLPADSPPLVEEPSLYLDRQGIWLCMPGYAQPFQPSHGDLLRRAQREGSRTELARACGGAVGDLTILDACAGFGSDGLLLAQLGARVCLVERQRLIWVLLAERARHFAGSQTVCADAMEVLLKDQGDELDAPPWDVILLDPMFPPQGKKALPNRGLQHLRELTQTSAVDQQPQALLATALQRTPGRVVVKKRLKDPVLAPPDFQIKGKSIRFDIYKGRMIPS